MKRLIVLASVAAFLVALPASHLLMGDRPRPKVTICHLTPPNNADRTGVIISVSRHGLGPPRAEERHRAHGDCVEGGTRFTDLGDGKCSCRLPQRP